MRPYPRMWSFSGAPAAGWDYRRSHPRRRFWVGTLTAGILMSELIALVLFLVWLFASPSPLVTQPAGVLVLAAIAVWALSIFPGWLYVRFLDIRAQGLWMDYVLKLHRLGWDRPRYLP